MNSLPRFRIVAGTLLAGLLLGCQPSPPPSVSSNATPQAVRTTKAQRGEIVRWITLPATIRAYQQATLYAKVAGYLKSIAVDRGDTVKEGDPIAEVEAPEMLADQAKYQAEVAVAKLDYDRQLEARTKAPDLVVAATVDTAKGRYEMAAAQLKRNDTLLSYTRITAPFSGTISARYVDPGALIPAATAGSPPQSAALVTLMDLRKVRVEVAVPASEAPWVKRNGDAELHVQELPGRSFKGTITRFAEALDDSTQTMPVEIELDNSEHWLRAGMFGNVRMAIERKSDALLIPSEALVREKARTSVFVWADGKAKKSAVKVGFENEPSVEILEGVKPEDVLILAGKLTLVDGQPVSLQGKP